MEKIVRFTYASNRCDGENHLSARNGDYYILDLLTQQPVETDPRKGWYRKTTTAQAAADRLNATPDEKKRTYHELPNGFVVLREAE